jgi:hypothetical protein
VVVRNAAAADGAAVNPARRPMSEKEHGEIAATWTHLPGDQRIVHLARSFHSLEDAAHTTRGGLCPWDPKRFFGWLQGPQQTSAMLQAGLFVLAVWRGNHNDWCVRVPADKENPRLFPARTIRFDVVGALGLWDGRNREAFLRWASNPWWP